MIELNNVEIKYAKLCLRKTSFQIYKGQVTLLRGLSGSGKTSLLYRIGLISNDCDFEYKINHIDIMQLDNSKQSLIRRKYMSFVLQEYTLFEQYDVLGNLELYSIFNDYQYSEEEYIQILKKVRLNISLHQSIQTLSGGERQRLAIACALCKNTEIIILDEPTSSLDEDNEKLVFSILQDIAKNEDKYVIMASHSDYAIEYANQVFEIKDCELHQLFTSPKEKITTQLDLKSQKLKTSFYLKYIKYFSKKYKKLVSLLVGIVCLSLLIMNISIGIIENYIDISKNSYLSLSENQIFITHNKDNIYTNGELNYFEFNEQDKLTNYEVMYPYIQTYANIQGIYYTVVPLYEENDLKGKKLTSFNGQDIYLSYSAYREMVDRGVDYKNLDVQLSLVHQKNSFDLKNQTYQIKGVLKKGVQCPYVEDDKFIYINYSMLENLYEEYGLLNQDKYVGYTIFTKDFQDYMNLYECLKQTPLGINLFFEYIEELNTLVNNVSFYKNVIVATIIAMSLIIFNTVEYNYFYKRQKEFALLKMNGLDNKMIFKLTCIELFMQFISSLILNILVLFVMLSIFKQIDLFIYIISIDILLFFVVIMITVILNYKYIKALIPESIFRN